MSENYSIVITGEWPGAGQSTTAKLLAQKLNFTRVYAGSLFRQFAHIWNIEKNHLRWQEFEHRAQTNTLNLDSYPFDESHFNESILHSWQHQLKAENTPEVWDRIIDQQSLLALQKPGMVVEGKVGVLIDKTGLGTLKNLSHQIFKILLVCPPEISAHRVIKRQIENGEVPSSDTSHPSYQKLVRTTTTDIIQRHLRDWERYEKIYGIKRSDIYKPDIHQIFTTNKSPSSVVSSIIQTISAARHQP